MVSNKVAESWVMWFVDKVHSHYFCNTNASIMYALLIEDKIDGDSVYKASLEGLSDNDIITIPNIKRYILSSIESMAGKSSVICVGIAVKKSKVTSDIFHISDDAMMVVLFIESQIWVPFRVKDLNNKKVEQVEMASKDWKTVASYIRREKTEIGRLVSGLGIASSGEPDTWEGFDSYDSLLKAVGGYHG